MEAGYEDEADAQNDLKDRRQSSGILRMITVSTVCAKEVAMAKVIEFHIPKNFRKSFKWVPEFQRGKILEFWQQTKKSA